MFATTDLSDAIDLTRAFLGDASLWTWVKLAVIVFFLGGLGVSGPPLPGGGFEEGSGVGTGTDPGMGFGFGGLMPELVAFAGIVLAIFLGYLLVGSIAEFVLLESLRSGEVHVRRYGARNVWPGVRLFGFRLAIGVLALTIVGGPLLAIYRTSGDVSMETLWLFVALLAIPVVLGYAVVNRFTTVFVAPTMLQNDLGVFAAWKRFWPTLTANWTEYLAYLLLVWVIQLVLTVVFGIVFLVVVLILAIPLALIALIPFLGILLAFLAIPLLVLIGFLVQVPFVTYLRYYALLVLGDTDETLDLIPDQRAVIRGRSRDRGRTGADESDGWEPDDDGSTDDWGTGDDRSTDERGTDDGGSDGWESDDHGSDGWESDDHRSDDETLDWDDDSESDSQDGYDPWSDSSESDDGRDDRDGW